MEGSMLDGKLTPESHAELVRQLLLERDTLQPLRDYLAAQNSKGPKKPVVKRDVWTKEQEAEESEIYTSPYQKLGLPFNLMLRALSCSPIMRNDDGTVTFKIFSPIMAYSVALYVIVAYYGFQELMMRVNFVNVSIDEAVASFLFLVYSAECFIMPVCMWLALPRICAHLNTSRAFHLQFRRVTGHELDYGLQRVTRFIAGCFMVLCVLGTGTWVYRFSPDRPWVILVASVPLLQSLAFDGVWCCSCVSLGMAATQLTARLKQNIARHRGDARTQEAVVRQHRSLRMELSRLLQSNNDVSTVTFSYHAVHVFLLLTVSLYALLSSLRLSWSIDQIVWGSSSTFFLIELWAIANSAHYTADKFDKIQWDPYFLIPDDDLPPNVKKETWQLLEEASVSPRIVDVGGFVVINRSWLTNMLGNLLSSLIILLQFRVQSGTTAVPTTGAPGYENGTTVGPLTAVV